MSETAIADRSWVPPTKTSTVHRCDCDACTTSGKGALQGQ